MIIGYKKGAIRDAYGSIIGYTLVELQITGAVVKAKGYDKLRTSEAKVLKITELRGGCSAAYPNAVETGKELPFCSAWKTRDNIYVKDMTVYPDAFTKDIGDDCGHGIHFFLDRESALNFALR